MASWEKGGEVLTRIVAVPTAGAPSPPSSLQKARSAPTLTLRRAELPQESEAKAQRAEYRSGLADLLSHLDAQCEAKRKEHQRALWAAKAKEMANAGYQRSLVASRQLEKPAWTYVDTGGGFFERPQYEQGGSLTSVKNELLQGIYGVQGWKPPHSDEDNGWTAHTRNDRSESLAEFGTKARCRMSPPELKYADRLDRMLAKAVEAERQDAARMTSGVEKRRLVATSAGEFSSLRREKAAWNAQAVATHVFFSTPEASKPGDYVYETGLREHVEQPARAKDFSRDIVAGDHHRSSFWKPRGSGAKVGSDRQQALAEELLCPPGIRRLRQSVASGASGRSR